MKLRKRDAGVLIAFRKVHELIKSILITYSDPRNVRDNFYFNWQFQQREFIKTIVPFEF